MELIVVNDPARSAYVLLVDGESAGRSEYVLDTDTIIFTHTIIQPEKREKGRGSALVRGALDHVRAETDYRVVAQCPFVSAWIESHPDYQDLLTR